jgi:hypothetical protein
MMMLLTLIGRPIGRLVRRLMVAVVPPTGPEHPDVSREYLKFPIF